MKRIPVFACLLCLSALPVLSLDIAGHVVTKTGDPVAQADVCLQGGLTCVSTAADGSFHITGDAGARAPSPFANGLVPATREGGLYLRSRAAVSARLDWLAPDGRLLASSGTALAQGENPVAIPKQVPTGLVLLRVSQGNMSVTWKVFRSGFGLAVSGSAGAGPQALAKGEAATPGLAPPPLSISKTGIHPWSYYPLSATEDDARVVVPLDGDQVLFDGKSMDGWSGKPGDWKILDNALNGAGNPGQIFTAGDYDSFRLFVTSRVVVPETNTGNGHLGILFWGKRPAAGSYGATGIQVQPPNGWMWSYGAGANPNPTRVIPDPNWLYHDWHTSELLVNLQTGEMRYAAYGIQVTKWKETSLASVKKGPIGMQIHATGETVEYKDIWIDPAPKDTVLISLRKK